MIRAYQFISNTAEDTAKIAGEFAHACELTRPKSEVWNIALQGTIGMGKSTFMRAFTKAVTENNWDTFLWRAGENRTGSVSSHWNKIQLRYDDFIGRYDCYFPTARKKGYGGYDILEHAPMKFGYVASVDFMREGRFRRRLTLQVDEKLWTAPVFQQTMQKLGASAL